MPYTLDDFPVKTNRPRIDVTLPVGRHEFELVVVDSAGLRSAPDRIVIYVEKEEARPPEIDGIDKTFGLRGERVETFVHGRNLRDATDIRFERIEGTRAARARSVEASAGGGPQGGVQLDARILAGGTETELPIAIRIPGNAALAEYTFFVTTRAGTAESPVNFLVTAEPQIDDFGPARLSPNETEEMTIEGRYLLVPSLEPDYEDPEKLLQFHSVEIVTTGPEPAPVPGITAEIVKAESKPESVTARISVGRGVPLGAYRVRVVTPVGTVDAAEAFQIQPER